jgi:hypothetical protein
VAVGLEELETRVALSALGLKALPLARPHTARRAVRVVELGSLSPGQEVSLAGRVSPAHRAALFAFNVGAPLTFDAQLSGLRANADLLLFGGNGQVLAASRNPGKAPEAIEQALGAGTYLVEVVAVRHAATHFLLSLSAPAPGGRPAPAISVTFVNTPAAPSGPGTVQFTASVSPPAGNSAPATGTVSFFDDNGSLLGTGTLGPNGQASMSVRLVGRNHTITVKYSGDPNYSPASTQRSLTFNDPDDGTNVEDNPVDDRNDFFS